MPRASRHHRYIEDIYTKWYRNFFLCWYWNGEGKGLSSTYHCGKKKPSNHLCFSAQIKEYLKLKIPLRRIRSILNPQLERPISYPAYRYFVRQDPELLDLWQAQRA